MDQYYTLRKAVLSESARKHELCYLKRFDDYLCKNDASPGQLNEGFIYCWIKSLSGKSSSIENEVIVIRQFLQYFCLSGEAVFIPVVPKVHDDYVPYLFSDNELDLIFQGADNTIIKDKKADPYLPIEFPVIIRLLYSCGLRIGETVRIGMADVDLDHGILRMLNTKGDKHRLVPMSARMTEILHKYCLVMGLAKGDAPWLFPSGKNDGHISDKSIKRRFESVLKSAGIRLENRRKYERGPCLHCMRHVFAFKSFAKAEREGRHLDDTVPYLSIYLGHESLDETSKYLKFSSEMFPEALEIFGGFMDDLMPEVDYEA